MSVKTCPDCAEEVQESARVCRHCGYRFAPPPDPPTTGARPSRTRPPKRVLWAVLAVAAVIAAVTLILVMRPWDPADRTVRVPSESMQPTYAAGDTLEVDEDFDELGRGDVVAVHPPRGAEQSRCGVDHAASAACSEPTAERSDLLFVKRIVAEPGDRVKVIEGAVYINGERQDEPFINEDNASNCQLCNLPAEIAVPPEHFFVMGDNRGESADSREWGPVKREWVVGKVVGENGG